MDDITQTEAPSAIPAQASDVVPTAYGWCSWCQRSVEGVRLIYVCEQGSGPGGSTFACGMCRQQQGLVPLADQP
jgi:hypothetical protein